MAYDWTQFTKSITVKTTKEKLYHAFASRQGMEQWFLRQCEYKTGQGNFLEANECASSGIQYRWLWWGWSDDTVESGQVLQANGIDVFEFTFNANGKNNMNIKISLHAEGNEWRVSLHQYNIPIDEESKTMYHVGCGEGWTFYLTNLKSVMEGGIDLRNKDEKVKKVINK
ncbi:MAG TPA: SRPBCC domain-containing protein [Ferruginibacter sp.]|nr:SRPBCC domain-containing protein [Ferruginibacter sp.]